MAVKGQEENILRTGYESVIPHRTSELFCSSALGKGRVTNKDEHGIEITYVNGEVKHYPLGRKYGVFEGMTVPHELVTRLDLNDKVNEGDIISYHPGYFKPDTLNPKGVVWCNGTHAWFALCESADVLEDASVISRDLAEKLETNRTLVRTVILGFDQHIANIVKVGDMVRINDPLMIFQDELTNTSSIYSDENLDILKNLTSQSPRAKHEGIIEKVEVLYRGDKEDMNETILKLANKSDSELAKQKKSEGKPIVNGSIDENFNIRGRSVPMDCAVFRFYITGPELMGVGDKRI